MTPLRVDDATEADLPSILAIYNEVIATTTAVYSEIPATLTDRLDWFRLRRERGFPVLVTKDESGVTGFGSFGDFRTWPGYKHSVEHSVHVREDRRGQKIGSAIVQELVARAVALNMHVIIGGVDAANEASIRMHEKLGFERAAILREVGRKFDRWLDLQFVVKRLGS